MAWPVQQPEKVFLKGNLAELVVQKMPGAGEANTHAVLVLTFNLPFQYSPGYNSANGVFDIIWDGGTERMYEAFPPNNSGNQILAPEMLSNNIVTFTEHCYEQFLKNTSLVSYFKLSLQKTESAASIRFTALRPGKTNLRVSGTIYYGGISNPPTITGTDGAMQSVFGRTRCRLTLLYPNKPETIVLEKTMLLTGIYQRSPYLVHNPLYEGMNMLETRFNVAAVLNMLNNSHYTYPETETPIVKHSDAAQQFSAELRSADVGSDFWTKDNLGPYLALDGRMPEFTEAWLEAQGQTPLQWLGTGSGRKFLTFAPRPKQTDIYAPEKLYYLVPENVDTDIKLYVTKYFKCIEKTTVLQTIPAKTNDILEIQASYLRISANELYNIYSYDIWLQIDNTRVSEVFRFEVNREYQRYARYFLFKNSWGMFDCLRTTGKIERTLETDKTLVEITGRAKTARASKYIQTNQTSEVKYTLETGFASDAQNQFIEELAESPHVLAIKGAVLYPVVVKPAKLGTNEGEFIHSQKLELMALRAASFAPDFASDMPILPDFNNDFNKDFNSFSFQQSGDYLPIADAGSDIATFDHEIYTNAQLPPNMTGKWTLFSGPTNVVIEDDTNPVTKITFLGAYKGGNYIFRWTVSYGKCTEFSDMVVTIFETEPIVLVGYKYVINTLSVANITETTAIAIGEVISNDGEEAAIYVKETGFIYGLLFNTETAIIGKVPVSAGLGEFEKLLDLSNLPRERYYIKAYATIIDNVASVYREYTQYGSPKVFDTRFSTYYDEINDRNYRTIIFTSLGTTYELFAENFDGTKYANGDSIPVITDNAEWFSDTEGAMCYYNNDIATKESYGALYNRHALNKITPAGGWRIINTSDANNIVNSISVFLGGGIDATNAGKHMKENDANYWLNNNSLNSFLFTARGSGIRLYNEYAAGRNSFFGLKEVFSCWSTTTGNKGMQLYDRLDNVYISAGIRLINGTNININLADGQSVRFIREIG